MIGSFFASLSFLNPWVLSGLIFLPALWYLLRVTPPAPRRIYFPPAHILLGLEPERRTPSHTPWWILLLRVLMAAFVICALAGPILNPGSALPGNGAIRLVIDNSWPAAQSWPQQTDTATDILKRAARENRNVHIMTTAPEPGQTTVLAQGPMTVAQAEAVLRGLRPHPWPADYGAMETALAENDTRGDIASFWLGHGIAEQEPGAVMNALQAQGSLEYRRPDNGQLPLLLRPVAGNNLAEDLAVYIDGPPGLPPGMQVAAQVNAEDGRVLDSVGATIDPAALPQKLTFEIPDSLRAQIASIRIAGRDSAGSVVLTDDRFRNREVGIVTRADTESTAPLIEDSYYIRRALETTAQLETGTIEELLDGGVTVLILPDIGAIPPGTLDTLERWVRGGGLLLRFAGPNMTQGEQYLTPVPLRLGGRALDGALTWEKPVKLAPFPESSPLYGLEIPETVTINRQILAEPVADIEKKSWAVLEDGTPLITGTAMDKGLLVMVHTTSTPLWSDLAVSGVFVKMLQRIVSISPGQGNTVQSGGTLQPILTLSGRGGLEQPGAYVKPLPADIPPDMVPDSSHPPGIYGRAGVQSVYNLGDRLGHVRAMTNLPVGVGTAAYGQGTETDLAPLLLLGALLLFALDWLVMMVLQAGWTRGGLRPAALVFAVALIGFAAPDARAQDTRPVTPDMIEYAGTLHLAYIRSGNAEVDNTARNGLEMLAEILSMRTSVEPGGVVAVNLEDDVLAFFPFIYWPIAPGAAPLSEEALQRMQYYIDHGGTVLIDTRDRLSATNAFGSTGGSNAGTLRGLIGALDVPPLAEMADDHVLSKTFYLMSSFPGRYDGGTIWVTEASVSGRDAVSPVIIGNHDWAAAWAAAGGQGPRLSGGAQQTELALRFGVNAVMYALTGNYKADQVHLPHILERLGQ